MKINSKDISVIVQGKIYDIYTKKCITSIKEFLPHAEIILSTWEYENVDGLDCDLILFNKDIGAGSTDSLGIVNNLNRQIVSSRNGIKKANRKYILKIRSDMYLINNKFLFNYSQYALGATIFKQRILVCDYYTRNPRVIPMPFCISDWIFFGLKEDVQDVFIKIPLQSVQEDMWFLTHKNNNRFFKSILTRYAQEQHITINYFKKYINIKCADYGNNSKKNILLTEQILAKNYIVIDSLKNGFFFPKYSPDRFKEKMSIITFSDWLELNAHYCKNKKLTIYKAKCCLRKIIYFYIRRSINNMLEKTRLKNEIRKYITNKNRI